MEIKHVKLKTNNRFLILEGEDEIGEMSYTYIKDGLIDINHTFVKEDYRDQNLGKKLINAIVSFMRENDIKAKPSCPYVKKVFSKNAEYNDVVA